jgi:HEPN pEK499 p136
MEYEDLLRDFVARTRSNLKLTDSLPREGEEAFFEVTQLINSLLGLIVLPRSQLDALPNTQLDKLDASWPRVHFATGGTPGRRPTDLRQLIIGLRNAVGHFNIEWLGDGKHISGLRFSSEVAAPPSWAIEFGLDDLRRFVDRLAQEIEKTLSKRRPSKSVH